MRGKPEQISEVAAATVRNATQNLLLAKCCEVIPVVPTSQKSFAERRVELSQEEKLDRWEVYVLKNASLTPCYFEEEATEPSILRI